MSAAPLADGAAEALGLPRHAEVRRRFVQAVVDAERTLRLEAAGYETTVVSFVAPTVTPHHLLWRARRVGEPGRMAEATERLRRLRAAGAAAGAARPEPASPGPATSPGAGGAAAPRLLFDGSRHGDACRCGTVKEKPRRDLFGGGVGRKE